MDTLSDGAAQIIAANIFCKVVLSVFPESRISHFLVNHPKIDNYMHFFTE